MLNRVASGNTRSASPFSMTCTAFTGASPSTTRVPPSRFKCSGERAGWHNRRHGRRGHLFQNRYKSIVVEEEPYLLELVRYVSLNPVRARLVSGIEELDSYPYTGHSAVMGTRQYAAQDVEAILARFGRKTEEARRLYREFVAAGTGQGRREEFQGGGLVRSAGGWEALRRRKKEEWERGDERVLGSGEFVEELLGEDEPALRAPARMPEDVLAEVSRDLGVTANEILGPSRERRTSRARTEFYVRAQAQAGLTLADLARMTGRSQPAVWQAVQRHRAAAREERDY